MRTLQYIFITALLLQALAGLGQQPFSQGNFVVYRLGNGVTTLNDDFTVVYIDEYTFDGVLVQSIPMPSSTATKLTSIGNIGNGGYLSLSSDGKNLLVPGFNEPLGALNDAKRSIGVVDFNGSVVGVTGFDNPNFDLITGVASDDGKRFWFSGANGVDYIQASSPAVTRIASTSGFTTSINIIDGQLYVGNSFTTPGIAKVGNGLPVTSGQTLNALPGINSPADNFSDQFAFADLNPDIPGNDVLYVACQPPTASGGLKKYSLVNGTWVLNGTIGITSQRYSGLILRVVNGLVTVITSRQGPNSFAVRGGEVVRIDDNSGYNGTLTATPTVLISAAATPNKICYHGFAMVPRPAPFTAGNIVVYRIGDGVSAFNGTAAKVYLDELTTSGTLVQSILMPVSGNKIAVPGASTTGFISLSANGSYLTVPGFNAPIGGDVNTIAPQRSIGVIDFSGSVKSVTVLANPNFNAINSATTDDGTNLWFTGSGLQHTTVGSSTITNVYESTGPSSIAVNITDGQLYISNSSGAPQIAKVGNGLPITTGQSLTTLPGINGPNQDHSRQFAFADLDPNVPGVDVLYISSRASGGGGLQKYSLVGGTWMLNGSIGASADGYGGLAIKVSANIVTVFASRRGGNSLSVGGAQLVTLVDNSGYNGTFSGTPTVLITVPVTNTMSYRGIARVPLNCPAVVSLRVPDVSTTQATILWNAPSADANSYEYVVSTSVNPPSTGTATSVTSATVSGLTNNTTYYVHVRTSCSATGKSEWSTVSFVTGCKPPPLPLVNVEISTTGVLTAKWNKVFGATSYQYFISTSAVAPVSGTTITDTTFTIANLNSVAQYYLYVRSDCGGGTFSAWTMKPFATGCFVPAPDVTLSMRNTGIKWNRVANASKYEYVLTQSPGRPLSGSYTLDTVFAMNKLEEGTAYYFHIRTICSTGALSDWSTTPLIIQGLQVFPNPVTDVLQIRLHGVSAATGEIIVGDMTGRVVARLRPTNGNMATIDTRAWATGVYFVRYNDGKNKYHARILKQ